MPPTRPAARGATNGASRFDPSAWAADREEKIRKGQELRQQNRSRLIAEGQLLKRGVDGDFQDNPYADDAMGMDDGLYNPYAADQMCGPEKNRLSETSVVTLTGYKY